LPKPARDVGFGKPLELPEVRLAIGGNDAPARGGNDLIKAISHRI
jgi:hypothetical protein